MHVHKLLVAEDLVSTASTFPGDPYTPSTGSREGKPVSFHLPVSAVLCRFMSFAWFFQALLSALCSHVLFLFAEKHGESTPQSKKHEYVYSLTTRRASNRKKRRLPNPSNAPLNMGTCAGKCVSFPG